MSGQPSVLVIPPGAGAQVAAIMACLPEEMRADAIAHLPYLKVILAAGVGIQKIDIVAATGAGVVVVNHPATASSPLQNRRLG